jgi:hypothetical protein
VRIAPSNAADVLESLIAKALELHADSLEIEYKDGQEEVCAMRGCVGVGIASLDSFGVHTPRLAALRARQGAAGTQR